MQNAALSAAPYLAMWILSFVFSTICDLLINNSWISRGNARKLFHSIGKYFHLAHRRKYKFETIFLGTLCPALGLLSIGFITEDQAYLSVGILILVGGAIGAGFCGFQVNHIDLSPNHSGMLMALSNGCTSIFSVISPLVVQFIVTDQVKKLSIIIRNFN